MRMETLIVLDEVQDDDLVAEASELTGITDRAELVRHALRAMVEREAFERLISRDRKKRPAE